MNKRNQIKIEGYSSSELISLTIEELRSLIFCCELITFHIGSIEVLGQFKIEGKSLIIELAHIDGGGEGILLTIASLSKKIARRENLTIIDWRIHAINCVNPNIKLLNVLEKKGITIEVMSDIGECYHLIGQIKNGK